MLQSDLFAPGGISHNAPAQRFEVTLDGLLCECTYRLEGGVMAIVHTGVPRALEGRGIAAALAWAQQQGLKVRPVCSYVRSYMHRHPETTGLLEAP